MKLYLCDLPRRHTAKAAICCLLSISILVAGCQGSGDRSSGIRPIALRRTRAQVEYIVRHREEKRISKTGLGNESFKETILEQRLKIETEGYLYHPNLFDFSAAALFGLQQATFDQTTDLERQKSQEDGEIIEFDMHGIMFQRKSYPLTLYARRGRSLDPRPFRSSIENTDTSVGINWQYVSAKTPVRLQLSRTKVELDPFLRAGEVQGSRENTVLRLDAEYIINEHNVFKFVFDHQSIKEQPLTFDYNTDRLTLTHRYEFGDDYQNRLESELDYFLQSGTFDSERSRWRESLSLVHNDRLRSSYQFELYDRKQGSVTGEAEVNEQSYLITADVSHHLYDSLDSRLSVDLQNQDFDTGLSIKRYGAHAGFNYRKKNRWGELRADYRVGFEREERGGGDQTFEIVDDERQFNDPEPIILTDANINLGSLSLMREDRTEIFQLGRDYTVRTVGDRVEIERNPTGSIQNGQTVLVNYRFSVFGSFELDTINQDLFVRQSFSNGITPYYRLRWQDQRLTPAEAAGIIPEDIMANVAGLEFRSAKLRLMAEYEDYDSTVSPFTAIRIVANFTHVLKSGATFSLGSNWSDVRFSSIDFRKTQLFTVEGRYRHRVARNLNIEATVAYRNQKDTLSSDDEGIDFDISLEWSLRKVDVELTYQLGRFRDDFFDQDTSVIFVRVRRRI